MDNTHLKKEVQDAMDDFNLAENGNDVFTKVCYRLHDALMDFEILKREYDIIKQVSHDRQNIITALNKIVLAVMKTAVEMGLPTDHPNFKQAKEYIENIGNEKKNRNDTRP